MDIDGAIMKTVVIFFLTGFVEDLDKTIYDLGNKIAYEAGDDEVED